MIIANDCFIIRNNKKKLISCFFFLNSKQLISIKVSQ